MLRLNLLGCMRSDSAVGVEHHADLGTLSATGKVLSEVSLDEAGVTVAGHDLAPHSLVVGASLLVLSLVDESDTLSVVEKGRFGVVATFDLEDRLLQNLGALTTLVVHKHCLLIESTRNTVSMLQETYLTGWPFDAIFLTSFTIFMLCNNDNFSQPLPTLHSHLVFNNSTLK
jgi:hypothetical protein